MRWSAPNPGVVEVAVIRSRLGVSPGSSLWRVEMVWLHGELVDDIVVAALGVAGVGESGNSQWH